MPEDRQCCSTANIDPADLLDAGSGFSYVPYPFGTDRLTLHAQGLSEQAVPPAVTTHDGTWTTAYRSNLTITLDDGTELHDDDAHVHLAQGPDKRQQGTTKR